MRKLTLLITTLFLSLGMAWAQTNGPLVTFTNVQADGTEYVLYITDGGVLNFSTTSAAELGEVAQFRATKQSNGKWTFYNESKGYYMIWRGNTSGGYNSNAGTLGEYNSTYCDWSVKTGSQDGLFRIVSKREDGSAGSIVIMLSGRFDAYGDSNGFVGTGNAHSNQFRIDVVDHFGFEAAKDYASINKWYYLTFRPDWNRKLYYDGTSNVLDATKTTIDATDKDAYSWAFIGNPFDGYKVVNKKAGEGNYLNAADGGAIVGTAEHVFTLTASSHATNGFFMAGNGKERFNLQGGKVVYWSGADVGSTFVVTLRDAAAELQASIANANLLLTNYNSTVGYVTADSKNKISDAISDAETAIQNGSGYDAAELALKAAVSSVNTIQPETDKYYMIVSKHDGYAAGRMMAVNANSNGLIWNSDNNVSNWFKFVDAGNDKFYLYNVKSGRYMSTANASANNQQFAHATTTADAKKITITNMGNSNIVKLVPDGGAMIHAQNTGNVVCWDNDAYTGASAWTIVEVENPGVAYIDNANYATLADAVAAWQEGKTINLLANTGETIVLPKGMKLDVINFNDFTAPNVSEAPTVAEVSTLEALQDALANSELPIIITAQIEIPAGETVTIDLNGKAVNSVFNGASTTNHIYALSNKGTLTINDSKGNGSINSRGIYNYGSLTLVAGAINAIDGNGGYAVNNQSGSTFVMNGGVVAATNEDDHQSSSGGYDATALKVPAGCTATLNGGTINNVCDFTFAIDAAGTLNIPATSTITVNGTHGAIAVSGGVTTINAGTFQIPADNYSRTDNVLYVSGGSLVVNGGTFIGDSDTASGGSCLWDEAGKAVVNGGTFKGASGGDVWGTTGTTIKGGTFENLTEKKYIADGYEMNENGEVVEAVKEVKVATLAELQAALAADNELPIILTETIVIPEGKTVVLDLNGKTVTRQDEATNYAINNLGTLTIQDTKGNGSINARGIYNGYGDGAANVATAKITVLSGTINAKGTNGGAAVYNYGIAEIKGGTFTSIGGYSLNSQSGASMTIADGVTANNGIYVSGATLVVDGGEINGNRSGCHVLYAWNSNVTIAGGTFHNNNSGNSTTMAGGTTKLTINGGTFSIANGKSTTGWTSCLIDATDGGKYEINGGEFKGHFRVQANCAMEINGGTFENTHGEAYVNGGTVAVKGGTFTDAAAQQFATDNLAAGYELGANGTVAAKPVVAKIGEQGYTTLQAAIEAVQEGKTITLIDDVNVTTPAYGQNALNHARAVSFTLDLNGKTLSANTGNSVFRFNFANSGATSDVTLTIKNGTIVAGSNTWCAVMAAGISADVKAIMNLENLTIESSKAGDLAVKAWDNAIINANNVTVNATNAAGGFYAVGGEIVLDNCTVNQKGLHTAPYLSMAFAVSTNGKMTVNSGTYSAEPTAAAEGSNQGSTHGSWVGGVMNSGGELIINGGTFSNGNFGDDALATSARGLIFADTKGKVTVNGGTFNALKSIFDFQNNLGGTSPVITVKGGNYSANPAKVTSYGNIVLDANYVAVENNDGVWTVVKAAAKIGEQGYASLQAAVNKVQNGETITLTSDVTENVTLTEKVGLYYTIDGNGKTMNGTITVNSLSDTNDNRRITIKNINFVDNADANVDFISSVNTNHYPRLTIKDCSFTGSGNEGDVAVRLKSSHSVVIKDCKATGLHSFIQNTSGWNLTIENVTVTNSKSAFALGTVQGVTVKGCEADVEGYGIRLDANTYNNNAVIENNTISAFIPVVVRKANTESNITVKGTNTFNASNTDDLWMAVGTSEYEENGSMPTAATGKVKVTLEDKDLDPKGVYGNFGVASIGKVNYNTLAEALTAAKDGETVNLLWAEGDAPIAMNGAVFGKNVTITGTATVDWSKGFLFVGRGGEGNATVTFDGANLTSASNNASYGIHVSGREKNTNNKYDGTLVIKNSTIELDYLINKGAMTLDKATLTVKNGFAIGGRPASETESGADATATISLKNESKLVVNNHNGMGLGYEAIGVMNIDATSTFETTQSFLVTAKGTMNIAGTAKVEGSLTNNGAIVLTDAAATLTSTECGNVTTNVANKVVSYIDGKYTLTAAVAQIGDKYYASLQAAIDAVQNGETIILQKDCAEVVSVNKSNVAFTIDGQNKAYTGKIQIAIGQNVTVKNVAFAHTGDESHDFIANVGSPTGKNYNTTLLVEACSFTGNGKGTDVAVRTIHPTAVTIKGCTASGLHSFLQNTGGQTVAIENVTLTDSKGGLAIGSPNGAVSVKGCNLTTSTYGVRLDANNTNAPGATLENNIVNAYIPVSVRKATVENYVVTVEGDKNNYTATNSDGVWFAACTTEYEDGVALNEPTGKVKVTLNDTGLDAAGIYGSYYDALTIYVGATQNSRMVTRDIYVATMDEAVAEAKAINAGAVTYKVYGEVELTTGGSHGILDLGKNVVIEGADAAAKLTIVGGGVPDIKGVTFKNIILADEGTYLPTANEFMYQNYIDCTFENVTFVDGIRLSGTSSIKDSKVDANTTNEYAIWLDAGEFTMTGTTVVGGADAYGLVKSDAVSKITITGNTFQYLGEANKEALNTKGAVIIAENNQFIECTKGIVPADKTNYADENKTTTITDATIAGNNTVTVYYAAIGAQKFESLADAFAAAQAGDEVVILKAGTYALNGIQGKNITVTGAVAGVEFANIGAFGCNGANVTFNNVTFTYAANSTYKGLQHAGNLVYNNCTFNGQVFLYGQSETFNKCAFVNTGDNYNVWTYGAANVAFNECTFSCDGKSVLVYTEGANTYNNVAVTKCQFNAVQAVVGKAAIEMDSSLSAGINLTIDGETTATGFGTGNVSGNSLWNNKKGNSTDANNDITVKVGDETVLAPVTFVVKVGDNCYATLAEAFAAVGDGAGKTVELIADVDLAGAEWTPVTFNGTFDGNGKTISNLFVNGAGKSNQGFFAQTQNGEIKNVTFNNAKVTGRLNVGVVAGTPYTSKYTNVKVTGHVEVNGMAYVGGVGGKNAYANWTDITVDVDGTSYVKATSTENDKKYRTYVGGVIGFNGEGSHTFKNISSNIKVIGDVMDIGGIFGILHYGNNAENITFTGAVEAPAEAKEVGGIAGVWHNQQGQAVTITNAKSEGTVEVGDVSTTGSIVGGAYNADNKYEANSGSLIIDGNEAWLPRKVTTKAELDAALAAAKEGDIIVMDADIDYGTTQLAITKAITLDLGGKTLTTRNAFGGMSIKGNPTVKNGNIVHASNTAAIKVWNATAFEDLVIDVQGKGDANKTIGGIVLQSGSTTKVGSIKNVTIKGAALTNGIETYNCGDATENVIGAMENVTIDAQGTGLLISAPCGTATNCSIKGGANAVEIFIKGTYSASLDLVASTVEGGVYAHDEFSSNPDIVNNGTLNFTADANTTGASAADVTLEIARAEADKVQGVLNDVMVNAKAKLNNVYYATFAEAFAAAKAGDTVTVFEGTYAMPSVKAGITIVGEGNVLFEGTLTGSLENLTMKNIHIKGGNAQRWAYAKGDLVFENVTFEATSVYALHFDGIAAGTNLTYKDCTIIGWAALGGSPASCVFEGCTIKGNGTYGLIRTYFATTIKDCTFDVSNVNTNDVYQDGIHAVEGAIVTVDNCTNANGEMADIVNIHATSVVVLDGVEIKNVAKIGDTNYWTLQDAINAATEGATVTVLTDIALSETVTVPAGKTITLDLNGKTISQEKACTASYEMISNKGNLTITGNGKISFKDTGAGDPNYGWGSYTVRNEGTLVVENGTIEHLGEQTAHMYCAIFQYSGKSTINGGTISTPNYRSARLWKGEMTVNGGNFEGQLWVQAVDNTSNLVINGGTFEPNGGDASAVFVTNNQYDVQLAVTDGTFNGKVGCSDATKLAGAITGGKFNETAKNGTNAALLATGYVFGEADANGYYAVEDDPATHYIATLDELKAFRDEVNTGANYYAGVTVYLAADIDMAGENWVGIGSATKDHGFMGNFDGQGYKIKNLTITNPALDSDGYAYAGLFGVTEGTDKNNQNTIKNLIIENVTITTTGHIAAAAIAYPYYTIIDNVKVCGDIKIQGGDYTAGVLAYTRRCVNASNLSIVGNTGSFVKGNQVVGGVISDIQMNGGLTAVYNNFSAEGLTVTGTKNVGGISGIIATQTLDGATVKNVALECGNASAGSVSGALGGTSTISNVTVENVTGATALLGTTYNGGAIEAKIGDTYYATLVNALAANGEATVELLAPVTIAKDETVVLNLNGKTVVATDNATGSYAMITNKGDLTINGEGAIKLTATNNRGWNAYSSVISNTVGGKLTVNGGTIEHLGGTDMAYAIDNLTNGKGTYAETVINGGLVKSPYRAVRMFLNGVEAQNILTVNDGTIEGANKSIWMQDPSKNANTGKLTVAADAELVGDAYLSVTAGSTEWPVEVSIAAAALQGESKVLTSNVPADYALAQNEGVYTVVASVASVNGVGYATLADAVKACVAGDNTIELLADCAEKVTITQVNGTNITINGNGKTYTGTITVKGDKVANNLYNTETLTFQNINFAPAYGTYAITAERNTYARNITVDGCTFKGNNDVYGIRVRNGYNYTVKNTTAEGVYTFFNASEALTGLTVENVTVKCANVAFAGAYGYGNASFKNVIVESDNNGVKVNNPNGSALTFENCSITAKAPVTFIENAGVTSALTAEFNGTNTMVVNNGGTYWFNIVEADATDATFKAIVNDANLDMSNTAFAASVGNVYYSNLTAAVNAAADGATVVVARDIELDAANCVTNSDGYSVFVNVAGKAITIDLNGKAVTANLSADQFASAKSSLLMAVFSVDTNGNLTLNDSKGTGKVAVTANDASVYSLISNYDKTAKLTINGGSYELDEARAKSSLIHSDPSEAVVVNGGNFYLGNVNTGVNNSPWIFNVNGNNTGHVIVNGGTFNYDINHQYWAFEVHVDKTSALQNNGNGTWTVVPAVAYVIEENNGYTREAGCASLADAFASKYGSDVTMLVDVELSETVSVPAGKEVVLDLNGKTISANIAEQLTKSFAAIQNRGTLTVKDASADADGKISVSYAGNSFGYGVGLYTISNEGGVLNIEGGTVENTTTVDGSMYDAIDNNSTLGETVLNISGGEVVCGKYIGVRQFANNTTYDNIVNVTGGKVVGGNTSIWVQNPGSKQPLATVAISGADYENGNYPVIEGRLLAGESTGFNFEVTGGLFTTNENLNEFCADSYASYNFGDGTWGVEYLVVDEFVINHGEYTEFENQNAKTVGKLTYNRTISAKNLNVWQALYVPFEIPVEALGDDYDVAYFNDFRETLDDEGNIVEGKSVVELVKINSGKTLKANHPYVIRAKNADALNMSLTFYDVKLYSTVADSCHSVECSSATKRFEFFGTYKQAGRTELTGNDKTPCYAMGGGTLGAMPSDDQFKLNPFLIYMTKTNKDGSPYIENVAESHSIALRLIGEEAEDGTTIIYDVEMDETQDVDYIYDLQGRRVLEPQKGNLYIINGKKVIF